MSLLRKSEQFIELGQIRQVHDDTRRGRKFRTRLGQREHRLDGELAIAGQEHTQRIVHGGFAGVRCMMQDLQIVLGAAALVAAFAKPVVSDAKARRGKQIVAVGVISERAGLAQQRIDDVAIVHRVPVAADQTRQRVDVLIGVPDFDAVGEQPRLDPFAAQTTVHRVGVAVNVHQAARINPAAHLQTRRQAHIGQVAQCLQLFGEAIRSAGVPRHHQLLQEVRVFVAAGEIAAAAKQQRLFGSALEVAVRRLGIAVLVRLAHIDPLTRQAVVSQQVAIARLELARRRQVIDRGAQAVTAMPLGRAAQVPQRVLQAVGESLERLRGAHRHRLPIRVRQHEVIDQVIERLATDGDAEPVHRGEVGRGQIARLMHLTEDDGLAWSVCGAPLPHPALEGAAMRIEELARMRLSQPVEERLGAQARLGAQPLFDLGPDGGKGVRSCAIRPRHARLLASAGEHRLIAVMSGRFGTHASSPCRHDQGNSQIEFAVQSPHLAIRNHCIPPKLRELRLWRNLQKEGILIVAGWGKLIDATQAGKVRDAGRRARGSGSRAVAGRQPC